MPSQLNTGLFLMETKVHREHRRSVNRANELTAEVAFPCWRILCRAIERDEPGSDRRSGGPIEADQPCYDR
jgi:hypothetical protein